ncbi:ubiquinone/menaquinone biosynthesis methyltransferase subfamily protein [Toxoplasma gondii TgCatPRC2]|uniref:2-methoxy-6-polyprenyl-1,4-benzoquinol methylase, mitochondrial n=1 Tax=Toxoplasma gondii TgCatPRC2 TaxID=1130821 RepID=A0A151GZ98_TOXGO|nr:ubiquinone/menaquinone biosynthesis methyltransferase subfamily protein [Toxoplasma gondii TgCatPRC2]
MRTFAVPCARCGGATLSRGFRPLSLAKSGNVRPTLTSAMLCSQSYEVTTRQTSLRVFPRFVSGLPGGPSASSSTESLFFSGKRVSTPADSKTREPGAYPLSSESPTNCPFSPQRQAFSSFSSLRNNRCTVSSSPVTFERRCPPLTASASMLSRHLSARLQHSQHSPSHHSTTGADARQTAGSTVSFGYRQVPKAQKQQMVASVFSSVAEQYDLMNDLMSMGLHRCWKDAFVDLVQFPALLPVASPSAGGADSRRFRILDLAGGTGDIAFRFVEKAEAQWKQQQAIRRKRQACTSALDKDFQGHSNAGGMRTEVQTSPAAFAGVDVTVCDINADMLRVGQQRAIERGLPVWPIVHSHQEVETQLTKQRLQEATERTQLGGFDGKRTGAESERGYGADSGDTPLLLQWVCGNGEQLPFGDESFDVVTIAFGIRNFTDVKKGLREAARVLRPGGRFLCLEFSRVENPTLAALYDIFSFNALPLMGSLVAGDRDAYQYLVESIRKFPPQEEFAAMMADAGFHHVAFSNLTFGTVAIHSGFKLGNL